METSEGRFGDAHFPQIDLSNKLIIKVQIGDDIRRIPIHNEDITYDELILMMQRVFRGKLNSTDEVVVKYKDEDGDLITIFDSSDLSFAIQCSNRILKLTLFVNGQPRPIESDQVKHIRQELAHIRNKVLQLMDSLEPPSVDKTQAPVVEPTHVSELSVPKAVNVSSEQTAMFDPYKQSSDAVASSFYGDKGEQPERAPSPTDSTSSLGSSSSNQVRQQQQKQQPMMQPPQPQQATAPQQISQSSPYSAGVTQAPIAAQPGYSTAGYPQPAQQTQPSQTSQPAMQPQAGYRPQQPQGYAATTQQQNYQPQYGSQQTPQQMPTPNFPQANQQASNQAMYTQSYSQVPPQGQDMYQQQQQQPGYAVQPPTGGPNNPYARNLQYGRPCSYQQPGPGYK
ncbi:protein TFG-like [Anneissia japonica]|uniref:protein TFG-like n=1 Tax=Anneissia japonica TaxID=1529436 RepID=UPI0014258DF0|nr:protein TFG-like [Anneissia japonica]